MAVTKLNPAAPPFHCSSHYHLPPPPPPPPHIPLYHVAACQPPFPFPFVNGNTYSCGPFPIQYPLPPAPHPSPPFLFKRVPVLPTPPHGRPPHNLMVSRGAVAAEKPQLQVAAKARVAVKAGQELPAAAGAPSPRRVVVAPCGLRVHPQAARSSRSKEYRPRKGAAPVPRARTARSPSPEFTTGPPVPVPAAASLGQSVTTVMVRNIPNRLMHCEMMRLLDDHCARVNKKRGAVLSAYDFLYLPMDFSGHRSSNVGYAFVNFTTAEAARRLQKSLNGCHWKGSGSQKVIGICAARIQGRDALVKHFSSSTFACRTDEFLPAVFSPPRDGAADPFPAGPKRIGNRVPPLLRWLCGNK